jgi:heterodisulfide reductase subunit B
MKYYPGCTMKTSAPNHEIAGFLVAEKLGIEMEDMDDWTCCGVVASLTTDDLMHQLAPIRNLARIKELGENEVVGLCDMCVNTLKQANIFVNKDQEALKTINEFMDDREEYDGKVKVYHYLEMLKEKVGMEKLKETIVKPLKDLTLSPYYGCMLLRPEEVAIDEKEAPTIMGELMGAAGAVVVESPGHVECCGSYHTVDKKEIVARRVRMIVNSARERGAEAIVLSCPLCKFNLDQRSLDAKLIYKDFEPLPVIYFTQLLGIAMGIDPGRLGLDLHKIDPRPLLSEKGLI